MLNRKAIYRTRHRKAFTLVEIAIALGVIGLIMGAIFSASKYVTGDAANTKEAIRQIVTVASNVQNQYMGVATGTTPNDWAGLADITAHLDGLNLLPGEMRLTSAGVTTYKHALGGSFAVNNTGATLAGTFTMQIMGLGNSGCLYLLMQMPFADATFGFKKISVNAIATATATYNGFGISWAPLSVMPITSAAASTACSLAVGNEIDITFNLHV